jgi:hypothetical protein
LRLPALVGFTVQPRSHSYRVRRFTAIQSGNSVGKLVIEFGLSVVGDLIGTNVHRSAYSYRLLTRAAP